jgi:hypothetical protein
MSSIVCQGCFSSKPNALAEGWEFVNFSWRCPNCLHQVDEDLVIEAGHPSEELVLDLVDVRYDDTL